MCTPLGIIRVERVCVWGGGAWHDMASAIGWTAQQACKCHAMHGQGSPPIIIIIRGNAGTAGSRGAHRPGARSSIRCSHAGQRIESELTACRVWGSAAPGLSSERQQAEKINGIIKGGQQRKRGLT